ncbi:4-hydroxy-tetrahydrodipicolinate synthase [Shouchella lehensis]|uniref:4-hydroxy-tetrahydrodipicolinate synthase n=2 Tax=Shouchella lehensis TaxID=300825 RepID=A0A4Y7WPQ8_9BACI|nr:4-hydroxy-tetrahydrodipicolinate synthase [Shouchella lehensis]MBG9784361.1 dihydrodipicolinate synthase [Shouchella lehensis]TES50646.1 4-hydroxy-tetrahydrodipicolinate synthase [Shouchella lehensis]
MEGLQVKPTGKYGPLWTAMVTPFHENGSIDFKACESLIDHLIATGTDVLVVAGTTGESPFLTLEACEQLFRFCVKYVNGRVPIVAGTGTNSTKTTVERSLMAEEAGVDAIMLVTPYYNKPSQDGLYAHFQHVATKTSLPIMLYNVPGRTGCHLEAETVIRLSTIDSIVAIKEASGDLEQIAAIIEGTPDSFAVYSGDDGLTLPVLAIGGDGIVSVASHVLGQEMKQMVNAFLTGQKEDAAKAHRQLLPAMKAMFLAPNPSCVKYALNQLGVNVGDVQLPLIPLNELEKKQVDYALASFATMKNKAELN